MNKTHNAHERKRKTASRRKKELALALAVSLWMAGGSLASAGQTTTIAENHTGNVYGNHADGQPVTDYSGDPNDNTVNMTGGNVTNNGAVFGAVFETEGLASGNKVTVSGGTISGNELAGAASYKMTVGDEYYDTTHNVSNNTVTVTRTADIQADIDGAVTANGTASSNHVIIEGGTVNKDNGTGHIYGGRSNGGGDATNNTVKISGGTVTARVIVGGSANDGGNATGNTVTVSSDVTAGDVFGGYTARGTGAVTGNIVTLNGAKVTGNVYGGYTTDGSGAVTGNIVTLNGATVTGNVYGGGTNTGKGNLVTGNTLNLSGVNSAKSIGNFDTVNIKSAVWGTPALTLTDAIGTVNTIDASKLKFDNPETIANGKTMNLITGPVGDVTLAAATTALQEYTVTPVTGVLVNAALQGRLSIPDAKNALVCTAENKATKLTFGAVEWKDSGALIDHGTTLTNVSFDGADVDTTKIHFTNIESLEANKKMTLVSSFGNKVGTITGTKYKVGSTLEGEGKASLVGNDLIFTAETGTNHENLTPQEQTHNTVMGATVAMAALSAGNDFVGAATEGLSLASNVGADGVSSYANVGGGSMRQETGSHVDTHIWNAIISLGHQNKKERGTMEYGAFFEYGSGNYTTHNGDERGDGSTHYTGGGLLGKYTWKNNVYVEGSLRAGTVHDDARNVLRNPDTRVPYSYETNANYMGFHLGFGKEIPVAGGNAVDVYGKYFFNRRNGVSFDAGGHYDLDAVTSQVIRVGARYVMKRDKWNFYAGAAYEHELDGKASGTADGVTIRGADTSGASFRGEIGATMKPGEKSPWSLDLNVAGFAGKKQGFTGGVSVAFLF